MLTMCVLNMILKNFKPIGRAVFKKSPVPGAGDFVRVYSCRNE